MEALARLRVRRAPPPAAVPADRGRRVRPREPRHDRQLPRPSHRSRGLAPALHRVAQGRDARLPDAGRRRAAPRAAAAAPRAGGAAAAARALHPALGPEPLRRAALGRRARRGDPRSRRSACGGCRWRRSRSTSPASRSSSRPPPSSSARDERRRVRLRDLTGPVVGPQALAAQVLVLALALQALRAGRAPSTCSGWSTARVVTADRDLLTVLGLGFLLLAVDPGRRSSALRSWVVLYLGTTLNLQWLANVFSHLLRLPVSYFEKRHLGDVVSRFGAVGTIQRTLTSSFVEALIDGADGGRHARDDGGLQRRRSPRWRSPRVVALRRCCAGSFYDPLRRATEEHIVHAAKQQSHFLETVRGVQSIKLFGRQEERRSRWLNLVVDAVNRDLATQKLERSASARPTAWCSASSASRSCGSARCWCSTARSRSACCSRSSPTRSSSRRASRASSTS